MGINHQKVCIYSKTGRNKGHRTMIVRGGVGKETKLLKSDHLKIAFSLLSNLSFLE